MIFKPLVIFGIIALFVSVVAGFFIRQKILNDWEIAEFNNFLKKVKILETEINNFEKDLETNIKNKENIEKENQIKEQSIYALTKSIDDYEKKINILNSKHTSIKKARGIESISKKYKELQKKIKENLENTKLSDWKKLLSTYYKTISSYISDRKNILREISKNEKNKEKSKEQKINLTKQIEESNLFLLKLNNLITQTKQKLNEKTINLLELKSINFKKNNY